MLDVPFRSARQLARDIRNKKIGCLELLDLYLARVEKYDGALNAVVVRDFERARTRARAADRALAKRQPWGPLHGVPMTIKESYDVAGLPTTWGVPAYAKNVAAKNAVVVDRLPRRRRGAVRQDQRAALPRRLAELQRDLRHDQQSVGRHARARRILGRLGRGAGRRAHRAGGGQRHRLVDPQPGALLRRVRPQADVGHRAAPRPGPARQQAAPVDIDVVGPLARSADDLALALSVMAGPDADRGGGLAAAPAAAAGKRLRDFKVALHARCAGHRGGPEVQDRLQALADFLRSRR